MDSLAEAPMRPVPHVPPVQFFPVDLNAHFRICVAFLCDALVYSYGTAELFERMGGEDEYFRGLQKLLREFPEGCVHVWRGETIVGQIELNIHSESRVGFVNLFYLIPGERGGGLGPELHAYATDVLDRRGVRNARLSVSPTNVRAMKFYAKHGWNDLGPRPDRTYVHTLELDISTAPRRLRR